MKVLIDGDILVYRTGFSCKPDDPWYVAKSRLRKTINDILEQTGCRNAEIYLSDSLENNYRSRLHPLYKANRKLAPRPAYYVELANELVDGYEGRPSAAQEADDDIGIRANQLGDECIIATIDKDLLQIPGKHFNWVSGTWRDISIGEGRFRFYSQILTGDATDNITSKVGLSCPGVGASKARRFLEGCGTDSDYEFRIWEVCGRYIKDHDDVELHKRIEVTGQLVKIRQQPNEMWTYGYKK